MSDDLLISEEAYLTSGVHIGTQQKSADMKRLIFKIDEHEDRKSKKKLDKIILHVI